MDYFDYKTGASFENLPENREFDIEEFLEESQRKEKQRIEDELDRIESQLEERTEIFSESLDRLRTQLEWYLERLDLLYKRQVGKRGEREQVKDKINDLYDEIRMEKRTHWIDRQELQQERREILRELHEIKTSSLSDLL